MPKLIDDIAGWFRSSQPDLLSSEELYPPPAAPAAPKPPPEAYVPSQPRTGPYRRNMTQDEIDALWTQGKQGLQLTLPPTGVKDLVMEPVSQFLSEIAGSAEGGVNLAGLVLKGPRGKINAEKIMEAIRAANPQTGLEASMAYMKAKYPRLHSLIKKYEVVDPSVLGNVPGDPHVTRAAWDRGSNEVLLGNFGPQMPMKASVEDIAHETEHGRQWKRINQTPRVAGDPRLTDIKAREMVSEGSPLVDPATGRFDFGTYISGDIDPALLHGATQQEIQAARAAEQQKYLNQRVEKLARVAGDVAPKTFGTFAEHFIPYNKPYDIDQPLTRGQYKNIVKPGLAEQAAQTIAQYGNDPGVKNVVGKQLKQLEGDLEDWMGRTADYKAQNPLSVSRIFDKGPMPQAAHAGMKGMGFTHYTPSVTGRPGFDLKTVEEYLGLPDWYNPYRTPPKP